MSGFTVKGCSGMGVTLIPNEFIDHYMAEANGEFVKVYLCLLRHLHREGELLTIAGLADSLNHTEKDVLRALRYWERMGLLRLEVGEGQKLKSVTFLDAYEETAAASAAEPEAVEEPSGNIGGDEAAGRRGTKSLEKLLHDKEFEQLLFIARSYLKKDLTQNDCDIFVYLYGELGFTVEVLEYLIESCVSNNHSSVRYMETVALDWHKNGITTVEKAKAYGAMYRKEEYGVLKIFGLNNRNPAQAEHRLMVKWFQEYGFTFAIVSEACNRTMANIHKPSFEYTDKILTDWYEKGVKHPEDIRGLDEKRAVKRTPAKGPRQTGNRFHNFEQREYDYDQLLKQIQEK